MPANDSEKRLELLMRVASSRLELVNEADSLSQKIQRQNRQLRRLKKKLSALPVLASLFGVGGGLICVKLFSSAKKQASGARAPHRRGSRFSLLRLVLELLLPFLLPFLKELGASFAKQRVSSLFHGKKSA